MKKVFISSTCYDLIDLRVEIEQKIESMGLIPLLSDRAIGEFTVTPDVNSIENCLTNVRNSDFYVIILSQRYGPSLKNAGFEDVSATHLEYLEAKKLHKPIFMYIRDRLESDYSVWKKNNDKDLNLTWVKKGDEKIFELLEQHRKLSATLKDTNWFWTFRDSVELKNRIQFDFKAISGTVILRKLIESGKAPHLFPQIINWYVDKKSRILHTEFKITNFGLTSAIDPFVTFHTSKKENIENIPSLLPGDSANITFEVLLTVNEVRSANPTFSLDTSYGTIEGHYMGDEFYMEYSWDRGENTGWSAIDFTNKIYYHSEAFEIKMYER